MREAIVETVELKGEIQAVEAVRRPRVRRSVTVAIAQDICADRYPPGSQLPRENDLCEIYGVSRTVIRESLKILESKGLLRGKPRVGTVVCDKDDWNILDADVLEWIGPYIKDFDLLGCILEARRTIEPVAAELAAERATTQQIADLENAWRQMRIRATIPSALPKPTCSFTPCFWPPATTRCSAACRAPSMPPCAMRCMPPTSPWKAAKTL